MAFETTNLTDLADKIGSSESFLICRASFETRAVEISKQLAKGSVKRKLLFYSANESELAKTHRDQMASDANDVVSLPTENPLSTDAVIKTSVTEFLKMRKDETLVVDVTCFRREELLFLIKHLAASTSISPDEVVFTYVAAEGMGNWLSKNPRSTRSVVGYPGLMDPLKPTHLIVLLGFEDHRVKEIINSYEPKNISLGISTPEGAITKELHARNLATRHHLVTHFDNISREFDFSATDPGNVMTVLKELVENRLDHNSIIAPLHTKLSTLGVGMFAINNPEVQVCYTEVEKYNTAAFSQSSQKVYLGRLSDLVSS